MAAHERADMAAHERVRGAVHERADMAAHERVRGAVHERARMSWLVVSLAFFAIAFIGIVWAHRRARREVRVVVPTDLAARIEAATRAFAAAPPWQPASDRDAPEVAAAIEAALIANDRARALELAEGALAAVPDARAASAAGPSSTRVWLAWALVANGQPTAALAQLTSTSRATSPLSSRSSAPALPSISSLSPASASASASSLSSSSSSSSSSPSSSSSSSPSSQSPSSSSSPSSSPSPSMSPLACYLHARAEHLQFEHVAGATDSVPALVTTADLAVVTLASGRGAATWLKGTTDVELSAAQAKAAIAEHRDVTARCLARALDALEAAPGFADAAYLVARLAVKAGLLAQARALFDALAPRMAGRPEAEAFARDRKDLADPASAVAAAKLPPLPPMAGKAKRSRSLKVL